MNFRKSPTLSPSDRLADFAALRDVVVGKTVDPDALLELQKRGLVETIEGRAIVTAQGEIEMKFGAAR
jgi:hypothetical protein